MTKVLAFIFVGLISIMCFFFPSNLTYAQTTSSNGAIITTDQTNPNVLVLPTPSESNPSVIIAPAPVNPNEVISRRNIVPNPTQAPQLPAPSTAEQTLALNSPFRPCVTSQTEQAYSTIARYTIQGHATLRKLLDSNSNNNGANINVTIFNNLVTHELKVELSRNGDHDHSVNLNLQRVGGLLTECASTAKGSTNPPGPVGGALTAQLNPPFRTCTLSPTNPELNSAVYTINGSTDLGEIVRQAGGGAHFGIQVESNLTTGSLSAQIIVDGDTNDAIQIHGLQIKTQCFTTPFINEHSNF